jgi:hypothetical protein
MHVMPNIFAAVRSMAITYKPQETDRALTLAHVTLGIGVTPSTAQLLVLACRIRRSTT